MSNVFFTSDTHFNHTRILEFCKRPFKTVEEMNESIIEAWNNVVRPGDRVYHLGDFMLWSKKDEPAASLLPYRLNGQIYLLEGNHDRTKDWPDDLKKRFVWIRHYFDLSIKEPSSIPTGRFALSHYPMLSWNAKFHGAFHLFGHVHGNLDRQLLPGALDVGVDSAYKYTGEYRPLSIDEVLNQIDVKRYWQFTEKVKCEENADAASLRPLPEVLEIETCGYCGALVEEWDTSYDGWERCPHCQGL